MTSRSWTDDPTGLEAEILGEKIATYVRIARGLERLVGEAHAAREAAVRATGTRRGELVRAFHAVRGDAAQQLWYLVVQREAIGLRHHGRLEEHYPIPPPIRDEPRR